jgi:O-antigen/teichoic acid export membrane protein
VKRPAAQVAYRAFSDIVGKGALFVVTIVAARRLTGDAFGVFSLGSTIGWMANVAADCGIQLHLARAVAQRPEAAEPLLRTWLKVRLWMAAGALAIVAACLVATGAARAYEPAMALLAVAYAVNGLVEFLYYFCRGLSRSDVESTLTIWQRAIMLVLACGALWWRADVTLLAAAVALPAVVTLVYSARVATRLGRAASGEVQRPAGREVATMSEFRRDVLPIGLGIMLSALYFRIDVFLIALWKDATSVGLYNAVFRLVEALRLFPAAALAVALPWLCRATDARPLLMISVVVTGFAAVVTGVLWTMAGWLVPMLYGAAFAEAVPAFRILLLSFPLMSLNYALTHQLVGWSLHRAYAAICAVALAVNVAANAQLIPALSIAGAAWCTLLTEVTLTAGCLAVLSFRAGGLRIARSPLALTVDS